MSSTSALRPLLQQLTSLRGFLPTCSSALLGIRGFATAGSGGSSSSSSGGGRDDWDDGLPAVNPKFRCVRWERTGGSSQFGSGGHGSCCCWPLRVHFL